MPTAALRPCLESQCPILVSSGRCQDHATTRQYTQERHRNNLDIRRLYRTARWRHLRAQKLRDNPLCVDCQAEGLIHEWTDLDHRVPHRGDKALFWNPDNLEGRCRAHHSAKTRRGE